MTEKAAVGESSKEDEIHIYMTVSHRALLTPRAHVQEAETTLADVKGVHGWNSGLYTHTK